MTEPEDTGGREPITRRLTVSTSAAVAGCLLDRARAQHREGVRPFRKVRSGLAALDMLAPSWWGVSVLAGELRVGKTTLAARIALETARQGGRVLWLDVGGNAETAIFRLLTGLARIPARAVFVDRRLSESEWQALDSAAAAVGALPISIADAHGATLAEVQAAIAESTKVGPVELVVVDGLAEPGRRLLSSLEAVAEDLDVAILAVMAVGAVFRQGDMAPIENEAIRGAIAHLPLRPGSLALHLARREPELYLPTPEGIVPLWLDVFRSAEGMMARIRLQMIQDSRWLEMAPGGDASSEDPL